MQFIRPVFKNGNKSDISNYKSISFLTSFSKSFEKVMQTRLLKHLTDHTVLSKEQYGFITNLKTDSVTYPLPNEIINGLNNKLLVEKVFDYVNHKILLPKLEFYGITANHYKL